MDNVLFEIAFGEDDYIPKTDKYVRVVNDIDAIEYPAVIQEKLDGIRCIWTVDTVAGTAVNESRNGNPFISVDWMAPSIVALARQLSDDQHVTIDGELIAGDFSKTSSRIRQKHEEALDATFTAFDYTDSSDTSYAVKARRMNAIDGCIKSTIVHSQSDAEQINQRHIDAGCEGSVIKSGRTWVRVKPTQTADLIIIGHRASKLDASLTSSLILDNDGVRVAVSGLCTEYQETPPAIGRMVEIEHQGVTAKGSLRHPVLVGLRDTDECHGVKI